MRFSLTDKQRRWLQAGALCYGILICLMCFLPQSVYPSVKDFSTPGIVQVGRVYFLPVLFNSLVNAGQLTGWYDYFLVLSQNVTNIFLLYPLVLCLIPLSKKWQSLKTVVIYSFCLSFCIEATQLVLDLLIDAGRVVELDDLWTNTLGGVLAFWSIRILVHIVPATIYKQSKKRYTNSKEEE